MKQKLTDICHPKQWKTIPVCKLRDQGYPVYGANGVIGRYHEYNHETPVIAIACRGASCGAINITVPKSYVTGNAMCLDDLQPDIDLTYLYYCLTHYNFQKVISGSAQPQITREGLNKVEVIVHSKNKQQEIVTILGHVDKVLWARQQQLTKLDELVKSRFMEMFGEWPANSKNWPTGQIKDIVIDVKYGSSRPSSRDGKYPYLRMNNITYSGQLDLSDIKKITIPDNELENCSARKGDVLFNRTNSRELVGKTCVYNQEQPMVIAGFIIRVRLNETLMSPVFLSSFLNTDFSKHMLMHKCKSAIGQANINAQEMKNIKLYIPPLPLQQQFAAFVEKVDKSKLAVKQSLEKLETLKKSLMQQYFG